MSSLPNIVVGWCCAISRAISSISYDSTSTQGLPAASVASVWLKPNTPHSGRMESDSVSGAVKPKVRATCWAWLAIAPWRCSTNLGALVVPEVVKMLQGALGRGVVGAERRARQQAVERHAPQPLDGGRHRSPAPRRR